MHAQVPSAHPLFSTVYSLYKPLAAEAGGPWVNRSELVDALATELGKSGTAAQAMVHRMYCPDFRRFVEKEQIPQVGLCVCPRVHVCMCVRLCVYLCNTCVYLCRWLAKKHLAEVLIAHPVIC